MLSVAIQSLWTGRCTVTVQEQVTSERTGRTEVRETVLYEDQPCRLSFSSAPAAGEGSYAATAQRIKLFLDKALEIPAGSRIAVVQNGITRDYKGSGIPAVYSTHQEIVLEAKERWA